MSFPRYESYKDFGVEWLGEVPGHWDVKRLKQICHVYPSNVDKKSYDGEQSVLLCNYTDVYYNEKITRQLNFMSATASEEQIKKFTLQAMDTIITKDSETADDIAIAAFVPESLPGVICGYHLAIVRPLTGTYGGFVKQLFGSRYLKGRFAVLANGLTRFGLSQYALDNVDVPFPPFGEQQTIAAFLDFETAKIDALIAEQQKLIALLKEKRQAVISHAVTKGLDPTVPMKDSGIEWLGEVPEHWKFIRMGFLFKQVKRQGYENELVLSIYRDFGVIDKNSRDDNNNKTPDDLSLYQLVEPGDLVINKMKAWQGSLGVSWLRGITSPDYLIYTPKHKESSKFLHYLVRSRSISSVYLSISNGIRPSQWRLEPEKFANLPVFIPPLEEQFVLETFLDHETAKIDELTTEAQRGIELLKERRSALISAAVTGKIDVRGWTPPEAV